MSDGAPLRPLLDLEMRRREALRRVGQKAWVLSRLARAGVPLPLAWVLEAEHYERFTAACLPRRHDLKSLIKLAGSRVGDERCARAYEDMLAEPIPDELAAAIARWWSEVAASFPAGVALRPSLAAGGGSPGMAVRHLHTLVGLRSPEAVVDALRRVWASSVLSCAIAAYAAADVKEPAVAVILQQAVPATAMGLLTRTPSASVPLDDADWHLGVVLEPDSPERWVRRAQLLLPMSLGRGADAAPEPLEQLRSLLDPHGFEQLRDIGAAAQDELGAHVVLHFAVDPARDPSERVSILSVDESPRWLALAGGDESTHWLELTLAGSPEPPSELSRSLAERAVRGAATAALASLGCRVDSDKLIATWDARNYLSLSELGDAVRNAPLMSSDAVLRALGVSGVWRSRFDAPHAPHTASRWRQPMVGMAAIAAQLRLEADVQRSERSIRFEARALGEMDFAILPNDALATTLTAAQDLLERSADAWARCAAAQLGHQLAIRALLARHLPEVPLDAGALLGAGATGLSCTTLLGQVERAAEVLRRDPAAVAALRMARKPADLPDGPGRGALGQLLSVHGDLAIRAFELSQPRWREDAHELFAMLALWVASPPREEIGQARALAEEALARYEPELPPLERRLLRALVDRTRSVARLRATLDLVALEALALLRRVALDIDRRLRRIDPTAPEGGVFHCAIERLVSALKSGRPELARVARMRISEREHLRVEPAPPLSFLGSPPRGGTPIVPSAVLHGIGVSPGVVEGRVRLMGRSVPAALDPSDVVVVASTDIGLAPLYRLAGGLIAESGGALAPSAEAVRELSVPAVFAVPSAALHLREGERVRIDGSRGSVQRLDYASPRRSP